MINSVKSTVLRTAFRRLPIPGRFLSPAIKGMRLEMDEISLPTVSRDRWNSLSIDIQDLSQILEMHVYFQGYFEYHESKLIRRLLQPGDNFLDIGANIGWHTLLAANRVGNSGKVYAVEPVSTTFARLKKNVELNALANTTLIQTGLSSRPQKLNIYAREPQNCGANSLFGKQGDEVVETISLITADEMITRYGINNIKLCKIDVEGAEVDVITGMTATLRARHIANIMIELNPEALGRAGHTCVELIALLEENGYSLMDIRTRKPITSQQPALTGLNALATLKELR